MERKVRGIDVIVKAAERKKKREQLPLQFAPNWHGELYRLGFKAIWRHCQRYTVAFSLEDTRDAIAEVIADHWEKGKLQASLERDELSFSKEDKRQFCWDTVNAYRRQLHAGKKTQAGALDIILGMGHYYQWRPEKPEDELEWIELKESLRQTLSRADYIACQLLLQGYSRDEIAETLKITRRTLRRRLDRLPAGKLLRILR
jgi:DNA-directed RNA polymerase specialized sigma24 family protein